MPNKMLIDASHPEETRVVVVRGNRIEEFDFESQDKKQLKGNIYLARVTRVEPSLQAAFVEYGGNRHGFLAFSEIHPDYYQIPVADRQALLRADAEAANSEDDEDEDDERRDRGRGRRRRRGRNRDQERRGSDLQQAAAGETASRADDEISDAGDAEELIPADPLAETVEAGAAFIEGADVGDEGGVENAFAGGEEAGVENVATTQTDEDDSRGPSSIAAEIDADTISEPAPAGEDRGTVEEISGSGDEDSGVESVGAEDALEEARERRRPMRRNYKIQEVIKRRQILLVQVVKEERGNKGAALTTYLSLAGRYSVLMPNTARGGGISRKITNAQDRKRLKEVVQDLDVPEGMGVILRTAGESRTKAEIKRDYEYLMRMWETVRTLTLQSTAPALVYEEGSLIKRSVRDLYNKDIDEILVAGEDGYREAKDFMRMLMPSHAKVVQPYRDTVPIFARNGIEAQLDRMLQPQVTLKSGGYIIINQTEALVSIDVNSGRSTKEHSIEDTALQTNLEAAEEVARQLRLRDLAGLIVIDFIDMEENRNNRSVEKRLKDHLKNDRARIQVGRISHFGLLEMSRQRIRASVLESTMKPCPHCGGTGHVRSDSSVALMVIRAIEEFLLKDSRHHITVRTPTATALYVLNHKRSNLVELERRFGLTISLEADETLGAQHFAIFRGAVAEKPVGMPETRPMPVGYVEAESIEEDVVEEEEAEEAEAAAAPAESTRAGEAESGRDQRKRRRRRRRGGRDRDRDRDQIAAAPATGSAQEPDVDAEDEGDEEAAEPEAATAAAAAAEGERKKRRRGKRGGRRNRDEEGSEAGEAAAEEVVAESATEAAAEATAVAVVPATEPIEEAAPAKPKRTRRSTKAKKEEAAAAETPAAEAASSEAPTVDVAAAVEAPAAVEEAVVPAPADAAPARPSRRRPVEDVPSEPVLISSAPDADQKPKKAGWWQKKGFF
ncbi:MAG: ribonuclease E/G [Rhizobiaceae bacterium]|uniref:Rne/Rng family ribonuclease n=1 Tax=Albidovulum sp. TaxID=1872424 RepID=UPI0013AE6CC4|nr:MAG: ribonuclease E/G [Rhizobiaceae bacterium]